MAGDVDVDDDCFRVIVVDWRGFLDELWRSRVRVDAPDEEEDEDEESRESFGKDGEKDEPVEEVKRRHHTSLMPPREKGAVGRIGCDFVYPVG